jgi:RHS repeat-associated protein
MVYDGRGFMTQLSRSNGVTTTNTFDPTGRRLSLTHSLGQTLLFSQAMSYDAAGNRTSAAISHAQALLTQAATAEYNTANQLTRFGNKTYTYDANGNRLTETDASGTTTFTWDARDRLKSLVLPSGESHVFTYDFTGQLIQRRRVAGGVETIERYVLDDLTNVAYRSSGNTQTSYLTGRYFDRLYGQVTGSTASFAITDGIGSVVGWADGAGAVTSRSMYEPYGATTSIDAPDTFQFTGRIRISGNLYYYRARFYDATTGRFLSEDPIGMVGGLNVYRYAEGDPISLVDPLGLKSDWLDDFQTGLDLLGLIPGLGEPVDGLNALIYLGRGQYGNAALSAAAMVPVIGSVGTGGKLAGKVASHVPDGLVKNIVKAGEAGGPGAGKAFPKSVKDAARAESKNTCVFCGTPTTRTPGPNQSNRGGNNTMENAQNTCRTCNLDKSAQTTQEYLNNR